MDDFCLLSEENNFEASVRSKFRARINLYRLYAHKIHRADEPIRWLIDGRPEVAF